MAIPKCCSSAFSGQIGFCCISSRQNNAGHSKLRAHDGICRHLPAGGGGLWLGEVVTILGLLLTIFGLVRSGSLDMVPFAVGAYTTGA